MISSLEIDAGALSYYSFVKNSLATEAYDSLPRKKVKLKILQHHSEVSISLDFSTNDRLAGGGTRRDLLPAARQIEFFPLLFRAKRLKWRATRINLINWITHSVTHTCLVAPSISVAHCDSC
jgi:hypothetical protein